jgi:hypothetical protein
MAWSQYTIPPGNTAQGDHVADLHVWRVHYHAVDEQLHQLPSEGERRIFQALSDRCPEFLDASPEHLKLLSLHALRFEALQFPVQFGESFLELGSAHLQLVQRQCLDHVGVDQALNLPLYLGAAPPQILSSRCSLVPAEPPLLRPPPGIVEHRRVLEHAAEIFPHHDVQARRG